MHTYLILLQDKFPAAALLSQKEGGFFFFLDMVPNFPVEYIYAFSCAASLYEDPHFPPPFAFALPLLRDLA